MKLSVQPHGAVPVELMRLAEAKEELRARVDQRPVV
jgi:hypothetical protein